ncbi:MAG: NADH-quinone oxidoreductase subunit C [Polyangia bacterium]|jgi:Ni,Fe-hydrogenase III large subunit
MGVTPDMIPGSAATTSMRTVRNAEAVAIDQIPLTAVETFRRAIKENCAAGARLTAMVVLPDGDGILAVLADDGRGVLHLLRTPVPADRRYPALTPELPQAQAFEREILEEHGIVPEGHPWAKPLRRHADLEVPAQTDASSDPYPFFRVEGAGLHEVAVGPVHAGIIEPGHFRFQCHGETVLHLEIQLGYQHRGAEALLLRSSPARCLAIAETIAGDTSVGHGLAYSTALEALTGSVPPPQAEAMRGIALELERLANHVGDLGALCNDVGYLPGASWFGRLRGEFLNLSLEMCGSRFGRGLVIPGGVRFDLPVADRETFLARLQAAGTDLRHIADVVFQTPAVVSRFEGTGVVMTAMAQTLGLVGVAARASGCNRDVRRDHPVGIFCRTSIEPAAASSGGVMARAQIRRREAESSIALVRQQVEALPEGARAVALGNARPHALAVTLVESWRGEIAHVAATDDKGKLALYKIVDPSFHNWLGLAMAMRGGQISDFPLCNKSFNLSYAGHDL